MSTAARKARKIAGIKFEKPAKVATPVAERSWFALSVSGPAGTKFANRNQPRSVKKVARALAARTV